MFRARIKRLASIQDSILDEIHYFGCRSPFIIENEDPQKNIIDVALKGTKNVMNSIVTAGKQIKRVILTSSVAGMQDLLIPHHVLPGRYLFA